MRSLAVVLLFAAACSREGKVRAAVDRGHQVYLRSCAACHGVKGDGEGPSAFALSRKPRSFVADDFRTAAKPGEVPTDDALLGVVAEGLPDSAMPSFRMLTESDRRAVVDYLKRAFFARRSARVR